LSPAIHSSLQLPTPYFFFQAEDGIRDGHVTGVQTCALPIFRSLSAALQVAAPCSVIVRPPNHSSLDGAISVSPQIKRTRSLVVNPSISATRCARAVQ